MKLRSHKRTSDHSTNEEHGSSSVQADDVMQVGDHSSQEIHLSPDSDQDGDNGEQQSAEERQDSDSEYLLNMKRRNNVKKKRKKENSPPPPLMWQILEEGFTAMVDIIERKSTADVVLNQHNAVITKTSEASSDLLIPLLRYQKEWLAWALKQEESEEKGGILADEMGMGKTLQAIALVLAKRERLRTVCGPNGSSLTPSSSTALPSVRGTLVICPLVAVTQWINEIQRFTSTGSTKVLVYHGTKRGKNIEQFLDYDFVITTYSTVEVEYRKYIMPPKEKCKYCGKSFHEKKLKCHLRYYCGPDAVKTAKQSKQERKKPNPLLKSVRRHVHNDENNMIKGAGKKKAKYDEEDKHTELEKTRGKSVLHSVKWERIILDEAHFVKDSRSNTARAVFTLESVYKWALSGTPVQNRVGELYSLIRFLQITPFSYYFCKDCDCQILDHSSSIQCSNCPHNSVRHFCWWNKYVAAPIQNFGNIDIGGRAMILLNHILLKRIVLRRTKKDRAADLALPDRIVSLRREAMDIRESDYYGALYSDSQAQFDTYVKEGTLMNNYAHIFDLLTRLRQAVDHPYLVIYSSTDAHNAGNSVGKTNDEQVCRICHEPAEDPVVTPCAHVFCKACLIDFSASLGQLSCPSCSRLLTVDLTTKSDTGGKSNGAKLKGFRSSSILNRIQLKDFQTSSKIEALRDEIISMRARDGSAKGIVFSQFNSFLDLINYSLHKTGINCVQLVGSTSMAQRDAAIKRFTEDPDCNIFLMGLKAGGIALNLTAASHVFLMDPWWNPAVERQAQDRIHRIGQNKPIRIVRFVIENTVEEKILKLQEKKELVFEGTVGGSVEALGKLTEADIRFLFVG